eukprot:TRINITY_DN13764_c0_g1_i1.p1 TRINITY_DN13764_c0_g1~~TRINITY_DN13764_c0_g1_i1.p1  ORF type:complete len:219 (-),score=26.14 TRINITY_DN13764_c0_g1_i1:115-771(-)
MKLILFQILLFTLFILFSFSQVNGQTVITIPNCFYLQNNITLENNSNIYQLTSNIDCSSINPFTPIGSISNQLKAKLDGKGFAITNLKIVSNSNSYVALFAFGSNAVVTNITLQDVTLTATSITTDFVGALFGICNNCNIDNVHLNTRNIAQNWINGGIYDVNQGGLVRNIGGLLGSISFSNVSQCSVTNTFVSAFNALTGGGVIGNLTGGVQTNIYN